MKKSNVFNCKDANYLRTSVTHTMILLSDYRYLTIVKNVFLKDEKLF